MKKGSETAKIYEAYRSLFSLPSKEKIIIIQLSEVIFFCILFMFLGVNGILNYVLVPLYFLLYFTVVRISVHRKLTTLDFRRTLGLSSITNGVGLSIYSIGLLTKQFYSWLLNFFSSISIGFIVILTAIVIYTNSESSFLSSVTSSMIIALVLNLMEKSMSHGSFTFNVIAFIMQLIIYTIVIIAVTFVPMKLASIVSNISGIELTRGFVFAWVLKEPSILESVLKRFSLKRRVPIGFIRYRKINSNDELFVIVSNIHPGPFLNVGSSNLPYLVNRWFKERSNCEAILLHGTCTHSENLPTRNEVKRVIAKFNDIRTNIRLNEFRGKVIRRHRGDLTYTWKIINNYVFLYVTKSPKPMDDIHISVGLLYRELMKSEGLDGLIVDTHNSLKEPSAMPLIQLEDEEARSIILETKEFLKSYREIEFDTKLRVGWSNVKCESISVEEGMGPGGVWVIYYNYGRSDFLDIILDANNLGSGVREKIIDWLSKYGYRDNIEVVTTDTHIVNAVKPGAGGYKLLQNNNINKILPCIEKAVMKAKESAEDCKVGVVIKDVDALMLGEENITRLLLASIVGSKSFKYSLIIASLFAIISLFFFSMLI